MRITAPTPELLSSIKSTCATFGATVRLRKLSGSQTHRIRLVLVSGDRAQVRDALVLLNAVTSTGTSFTSPDCRFCWNGDQINIAFPEAA